MRLGLRIRTKTGTCYHYSLLEANMTFSDACVHCLPPAPVEAESSHAWQVVSADSQALTGEKPAGSLLAMAHESIACIWQATDLML